MSDPAKADVAPTPGELNIARTASQAFGVIWRQGLALVVLTLVFGGVPVLVFWQVYGFPPDISGRLPPLQRLPYLVATFLTDGLLAAAVTRVVLSDRLQGASLNPRQALALSPGGLTGLFAALLMISGPGMVIEALEDISHLPQMLYLAASLGMVLFYAVLNGLFSPTVSVVMLEGLGGWAAVRRAVSLGRGHRVRLIGAFAFVGAGLFVARWAFNDFLGAVLLGAASLSYPMVSAIQSLVWIGVGGAVGIFYGAWFPCLYLALRKTSEGLGEDEIEVFS